MTSTREPLMVSAWEHLADVSGARASAPGVFDLEDGTSLRVEEVGDLTVLTRTGDGAAGTLGYGAAVDLLRDLAARQGVARGMSRIGEKERMRVAMRASDAVIATYHLPLMPAQLVKGLTSADGRVRLSIEASADGTSVQAKRTEQTAEGMRVSTVEIGKAVRDEAGMSLDEFATTVRVTVSDLARGNAAAAEARTFTVARAYKTGQSYGY